MILAKYRMIVISEGKVRLDVIKEGRFINLQHFIYLITHWNAHTMPSRNTYIFSPAQYSKESTTRGVWDHSREMVWAADEPYRSTLYETD